MNSVVEVDLLSIEGDDFRSDSIRAVGYNRPDSRLYVEFKSAHTLYVYEEVAESLYNLFVSDTSLNYFWRTYLSGKYESRKIDGPAMVLRQEEDTVENPEVELANGGKITGDGLFTLNTGCFTLNFPSMSRFSVKWSTDEFNSTKSFEPEYTAQSSADAILRCENEISSVFGGDFKYKIVSVTQYFD